MLVIVQLIIHLENPRESFYLQIIILSFLLNDFCLFSLSGLCALASAFRTWKNRRDSEHLFLVPDFVGNTSNVSPVSTDLVDNSNKGSFFLLPAYIEGFVFFLSSTNQEHILNFIKYFWASIKMLSLLIC